MLLEASAALALCIFFTSDLSPALLWIGLGLLALVWFSTFAWQVPCHNALSKGFDPERHAWLVRSNWLRTVLWTMRACLALYLLPIWD